MFILCYCRRVSRLAKGWRRYSVGNVGSGTGESPLRKLLAEASAFGEAEARSGELQWATQPYAAAPATADAEGTARVQPADASVLLFPGEGAARPGMGARLKDVPAARDLYNLASEVLGWDVWRACAQTEVGSERAAACVLVTALAALERARDERPAAVERARAAAGYSAGELAALVFAGALPLEQALRLAEVRAAALASAARARAGGLLSVWLSPAANLPHALLRAREHAAAAGVQRPVCQVAAYLYPGCKLVAGDEEALKWLEQSGARFGVQRAARVQGAGAWHSALMEGARAPLRAALRLVEVAAPRVCVMSGAEGAAYRDAAHVRRGLERLGARPLRWEQTLHALFARPRSHALPLVLALGPHDALLHSLRHVNARAYDNTICVPV